MSKKLFFQEHERESERVTDTELRMIQAAENINRNIKRIVNSPISQDLKNIEHATNKTRG